MRIATALMFLGLVSVGATRVFDPSARELLQAARQVGPTGGWRCVSSATYTYDPTREEPDAGLVSDPPEALVLQRDPQLELDSVEISLRGGDSLVWAHVGDLRRVYVLSPGRLQPVTLDSATLCNSELGDWRIVEEHSL